MGDTLACMRVAVVGACLAALVCADACALALPAIALGPWMLALAPRRRWGKLFWYWCSFLFASEEWMEMPEVSTGVASFLSQHVPDPLRH